MAAPQSSFIVKHNKGFGGWNVDSVYLGASYETGKPHVFMDTLMKIYSSQSLFTSAKPLLGMTGGRLNTKEIDTEIYQWYLQGAEEKCGISMGIVDANNTTPGLGNTEFQIKLDLDYYGMPDILFPEDNDFPLRIVSGPVADGTGFVYTVALVGEDPTAFLPTSYLEAGREFSKVWTQVPSERNKWYGTQQYPSSFKLESQVGAFGQKFEVTDKAWRDQGRMEIEFLYTDPKTGKEQKINKFLPMAEAKMNDALYMGMEAAYMYGKKSTYAGPDGYWTKTGSGLREQLRDGFLQIYNGALTTNRIKDYFLNIFVTREDESERAMQALTGTIGSLMFHDTLAAEAASFLTLDTHFISKYSHPVKGRQLSFGAQYRHYQGPEGIELSLMKYPLYDSRKYSKRVHPQWTNLPIDSARMTFLDFGKSGGENNIQMLRVKDTYRWGYKSGTHTPMGPVKGGQVGDLIAGYVMFTEGTGGIFMRDATRGGELIYDNEF